MGRLMWSRVSRWFAAILGREHAQSALPSGHSPMSCVLYTRVGCCLCDQAETLLRAHGLQPEKVDIDQDEALRARYTECVPVVVIDGKERFRGRVDERLLVRLLKRR